MTAYGSIAHAVEAVRMGADDYLSKPINPVLLKARIGLSREQKLLREV